MNSEALKHMLALLFRFYKHIYSNHAEQVALQLSREPYAYPTLHIKRKPESIFDYQFEDFEVSDYQCHAAIKAPVAV
jgi:thymidylate synthase